MRRLTILVFCSFILSFLKSQPRVLWEISGITEGDWNMTEGRVEWVNCLEAGLGVVLWKGAMFEGTAIATYSTADPVSDDLLGFSNIYTGDNKPFRLMQASLGQRFGKRVYVSAGLRNIDTDYFTSPATSLFTAPADADFPIISNNYSVATFPMSALGVHLEIYPFCGFTVKSSLYNGVADDTFKRQFRFRPGRDGLFSIGSLSYEWEVFKEADATYAFGYVAGKVPDGEASGVFYRKTGVWGLVEQPFLRWGTTRWCLLLQGAMMTRYRQDTYGYWGTGLTVSGISGRNIEAGVAVNRMHDLTSGNEVDAEVTCVVPFSDWLSVQPAVHVIRSRHREMVVGLLRLNVTFGNR